ncbi:MAG: protein kinase domain-containing protein, partial [Kofleriaceae bacterium]
MSVASATPLLGGGRFEVRGTLGSGGAGVVYRVLDRQVQREVALKLLRQASGRDLFRFKREFRALADIVHPHLVTLHEMHATGGDWFFTMELVEGVSFIDWVRPGQVAGPARTRPDIHAGVLDAARLRGALVQLVDALSALHAAGKLHRDLKPSNVLVTGAGRLVLLDFGLVASVAEGDPERLAVGTPVYMSPEQASDQRLGEASDWYSVGAMLYEALTGQRPFEGDSEQVMTRKQTELPAPPDELANELPDELVRLCVQLLHPHPEARPRARDILVELGAATGATPPTPVPAPAFVGRGAEIEQLRRALADARRGGVAVTVRGKSGMGKSTLVRRFLRGLGDAVFALEGRCFEREAVPFKMLDGVVDALTSVLLGLSRDDIDAIAPRELGSVVRMFPVLRRVPRLSELAADGRAPAEPQELRRRGFRALRMLLARLARIRPIVLFVDDAHWGDGDSAVFLAELIHGLEPNLLVIVAHRPEDYLGIVAQLRRPPAGNARRGDLREIDLAALTDQDAAALATQLAPDPDRARIAGEAAHGHPLVLCEMARAPELAPGTQIGDLVRARVARLDPDAQAMLAVSSIAARPLPVELAAHAAGVVGGHDAATQLSVERLATLRRNDSHKILHTTQQNDRPAIHARLDAETQAGW